jgi:hypothetical protein
LRQTILAAGIIGAAAALMGLFVAAVARPWRSDPTSVGRSAGVVRPGQRAPGFRQVQNHEPPAHQILVMRPHQAGPDDGRVDQVSDLYALRISGHLGPTALSAYPSMVAQLKGGDTLLTGLLDRSALYGVLAEIEVLGLDLVELRRLLPRQCQGA